MVFFYTDFCYIVSEEQQRIGSSKLSKKLDIFEANTKNFNKNVIFRNEIKSKQKCLYFPVGIGKIREIRNSM